MSSEMRELIAKWRDTADQCEERGLEACSIGLTVAANKADARADELRGCANELEALLARTEAGADGDKGPWRWKRTGSKVDVYSDDFTHDVALRIDGDFASEADADVYAAWLAGRLNTHPQDASGDAAMTGPGDHDDLPAFLEWVAGEVVRRDTRAGNFAEGLAQSLRGRAHILRIVKNDAMQAKEAK